MPITFRSAAAVPEEATAVVFPVSEGDLAAADNLPTGVDAGFLARSGFEGKPGETQIVPSSERTLVLIGVGRPDEVACDVLRRAGAGVARVARRHPHIAVERLHAFGPGPVSAFVEGVALASYRFDRYKVDPQASAIESVTVVGVDSVVDEELAHAATVARAVAYARDLVNEPAGMLSPARLAAIAEQAAGEMLEVSVRDSRWIEQEGLGGLAAVGRGSSEEPRLIEMRYSPPGPATGHVVLVGKGITFDSGGLSLKPGDSMSTMKYDMAGGAAVIATMSALPALGISTAVSALIPAAENMPGNGAVKPGDVIRARNGKTIEVLNTDAEGRLILADALSLAVDLEPDAIIDIATLTGAQIVALGRGIAAVLGNDDTLIGELLAAGERTGEPLWRLPLAKQYREDLDSQVADLKNIGGQAGTIMAGLFLSEFVDDTPWAHLDIAGPAWTDRDAGINRHGGTGFGVRALLEFLAGFESREKTGALPVEVA